MKKLKEYFVIMASPNLYLCWYAISQKSKTPELGELRFTTDKERATRFSENKANVIAGRFGLEVRTRFEWKSE